MAKKVDGREGDIASLVWVWAATDRLHSAGSQARGLCAAARHGLAC